MKRRDLVAGAVSFLIFTSPAFAANQPVGFSPDHVGLSLPVQSVERLSQSQPQLKPIRLAKKLAKKSVAKIRAKAISSSMVRLQQLRPYASNFGKMKAAVRAYWHRNIHKPSASGLTAAIMRHVAPEHRSMVRDPVYSSALNGTRKVRAALAN